MADLAGPTRATAFQRIIDLRATLYLCGVDDSLQTTSPDAGNFIQSVGPLSIRLHLCFTSWLQLCGQILKWLLLDLCFVLIGLFEFPEVDGWCKCTFLHKTLSRQQMAEFGLALACVRPGLGYQYCQLLRNKFYKPTASGVLLHKELLKLEPNN